MQYNPSMTTAAKKAPASPRLTITQFRKDLFQFVDSAANGDVVEFLHKGIRFQLMLPDAKPVDKLDRVTRLAADILIGSPAELVDAHRAMSHELIENWEANWNTRLPT